MKRDADLFDRSIRGYNCLEVAIEGKNKAVVEYLIGHEDIFALMRNAQFIQPKSSASDSKNNDNNANFLSRCYNSCASDECSTCCPSYCYRLCHDSHKADTPMRKLIRSMPDMALKVLDKCVKTVEDERTKLYAKTFNHEFLEDHFTILR